MLHLYLYVQLSFFAAKSSWIMIMKPSSNQIICCYLVENEKEGRQSEVCSYHHLSSDFGRSRINWFEVLLIVAPSCYEILWNNWNLSFQVHPSLLFHGLNPLGKTDTVGCCSSQFAVQHSEKRLKDSFRFIFHLFFFTLSTN